MQVYSIYSGTGFLISAVKYMIKNYSVDTEHIYFTRFSNGGAASVALTRDYPKYFVAVSAMGWMVDLYNKDNVFDCYDMPFQVVQGNREFTEKMDSGPVAVMDERMGQIMALIQMTYLSKALMRTVEVPAMMRKTFPMSERREDTFIGGFSMGGYGAIHNGLKYCDTFSHIIALSNAVHMFQETGIGIFGIVRFFRR